MSIKRKTLLTLVLTFFTLSYAFLSQTHMTQIARAQDEPDAVAGDEPQSTIEPEALDVLKKMSDALDSQQKFSFNTEVAFDELLTSGQMIQYGGTMEITVKRPNKVYAELTGDRTNRKAWYNGKNITILSQNKNFYGQIETPDSIDETLDFLINSYDFTLPLADILHTDPFGSFSDGAVDGVILSNSMVRGKECSHLAFVGNLIDWQVWVANDGPALPCKLVITYKDQEEVPQYQAVFYDWNLNPDVPDSIFNADLPEGAVKIEFIDMKKQRGSEK